MTKPPTTKPTRDDPDAAARLARATRTVASVFGGRRGSPHWGDALPHHPHQTKGMSWEAIERLHERPAKLPVTELDWAEIDYFFSHAGYTMEPAKTLPEAMRYYLPRLAEFTVPPEKPDFRLGTLVIGSHFGKVPWLKWKPREADAIREWLTAWANAAVRCRETEWQTGPTWSVYEPCTNRDPMPTLDIVACAGLPPTELRALFDALNPEQTVRLVGHALIQPDRQLYDAAYAVLDPWITAPQTQQKLLDAATANQPYSPLAELLFGRDPLSIE